MTYNAEIAMKALLKGKPVEMNHDRYILSADMRICKVVSNESNLDVLEECDMSLSSFIQLSQQATREDLILASL